MALREAWLPCRLFLSPYLLEGSRVCGEGSQACPSQAFLQNSVYLFCEVLYLFPVCLFVSCLVAQADLELENLLTPGITGVRTTLGSESLHPPLSTWAGWDECVCLATFQGDTLQWDGLWASWVGSYHSSGTQSTRCIAQAAFQLRTFSPRPL